MGNFTVIINVVFMFVLKLLQQVEGAQKNITNSCYQKVDLSFDAGMIIDQLQCEHLNDCISRCAVEEDCKYSALYSLQDKNFLCQLLSDFDAADKSTNVLNNTEIYQLQDMCSYVSLQEDIDWSSWSSWSSCTSSCSKIARIQTASVSENSITTMFRKEVKSCQENACRREKRATRKTQQYFQNTPARYISNAVTVAPSVYGPSFWGAWNAWSGCLQPCQGNQERVRKCADTQTEVRPCPCGLGTSVVQPTTIIGRSSQPVLYSNPPVLISNNAIQQQQVLWSQWGQWSFCSATCGIGRRSRTRVCLTFPAICPGSSQETQQCNSPLCITRNQWLPWEAWQQCSVTCGTGSRIRYRQCGGAPGTCVGQNTAQGSCYTDCPLSQWDSWQQWSQCSVSCGPGGRTRIRTCRGVDQNCQGRDKETQPCNDPCPIKEWMTWEQWSRCSVSCGSGVHSRSRRCSDPFQRCPGRDEETGPCFDIPCPRSIWLPWETWRPCSVTCGQGTRLRTRTCDGTSCRGESSEVQPCSEGPCCTANWIQWEQWSRCSVTCGPGTQNRRRLCDDCNRRSRCIGQDYETRPCSDGTCCTATWLQWEQWSRCSVTCGPGTQTRRRRCDDCNGRSNCIGQAIETYPCNSPVPCTRFRDWSSWGPCSVTCGYGRKTRQRDCTDNSFNCYGLGPREQDTGCEMPPCQRQVFIQPRSVSQFGTWSQWSRCTGACGQGTRSRTRSCAGGRCYGPEQDTQRCPATNCDSPPTWIEWGPWGVCIPLQGTCGTGTRQRRRMCLGGLENQCESIWNNQNVEDRACDVVCYKQKARPRPQKDERAR